MVQPRDVTVDNLRPEIEQGLYGAVTATQAVLPAMLENGAGTLLFTTGGGAINPYPMLAATNMAQAALRNWVFNLHNTLSDQGVFAANVAINVFIGASAPDGSRTSPRTSSPKPIGSCTPAATEPSISLSPDPGAQAPTEKGFRS
jgi:NAD(P)-dependent dehydrogenase (short-subunit alcohol dehydrogenase family)